MVILICKIKMSVVDVDVASEKRHGGSPHLLSIVTSPLLSSSQSPSTNHPHHQNPIILRRTTSSFKTNHNFPISPVVRFPTRDRVRGTSLVTRAGASTSTYVLAFVLPFSLVVLTVLTSIRIADKLDRDYLEEVALNQAIREADEEEEDDDYESPLEQPATPRSRNRPKREV